MWLRGGASAVNASANPLSASGAPSARTSTPAEVLSTQPQPVPGRERVDEGPEADALDDAADADAYRGSRGVLRSGWVTAAEQDRASPSAE